MERIWNIIEQKLSEYPGSSKKSLNFSTIGGGSINETYRIESGDHIFFCKINSAVKFPRLFEKEKAGLDFIRKWNIIQTPQVVNCFETGKEQVLILEWIDEGERNKNFWSAFGEQLARLHHVANDVFGFEHDNYMGSVEQSNRYNPGWTEFFVNERLRPLVEICIDQNLLSAKHSKQFESLYLKLSSIYEDDSKPALVHGDLWSGNFMCNKDAQPVLIDPAVYFGHPSIDLGMTTLFGGFDNRFYESYNFHNPFPANYKEQWAISNLYPLLIHVILFGRSYVGRIESILGNYT